MFTSIRRVGKKKGGRWDKYDCREAKWRKGGMAGNYDPMVIFLNLALRSFVLVCQLGRW